MSKLFENLGYTDYEQGIREVAPYESPVTLAQPSEPLRVSMVGANTLELVAAGDTFRVWTEAEIAALRVPEQLQSPYEK